MDHLLLFSFMGLGDMVMFTPVLRALRRHYPSARLSVVARTDTAPLFQNSSLADAVYPVDRHAYRQWKRVFHPSAGVDAARLLRFLRARPIDLAIVQDYTPFALAVAGSLLVMGGARRRMGFAMTPKAGRWLTDRLPYDPGLRRHETARYRDILKHLQIDDTDPMPDVALRAEERVEAQSFLRAEGIESGERVIGIHPGSSERLKRWPAERFVELSAAIASERLGRIVLVGAASERATAREIAARCGAVNAVGRTTVRQLVGLASVMDVLVTPDSGPMHIAAAVGTPTISLFGPTDPARVAPLGAGHQVLNVSMPCGPCFRAGKFPNCPKPICMEGVTVPQVLRAVRRAFEQQACPMSA